MVNPPSHSLLKLSAPIEALLRPFRRLNAIAWNIQYKWGAWDYLDSFADGVELLKLVAEYMANPVILDLGCGTSANLPLTQGAYRHYHGVDISTNAISKARALGRPYTSFEAADILTYEAIEKYDAILLREVLYYFTPEQTSELLRNLTGMLRPDGKIFIQFCPDGASNYAEVVRDCGLPIVEERDRRPDHNGTPGLFIVLEPPKLVRHPPFID
jgi:SAM-dependent methyltransferase